MRTSTEAVLLRAVDFGEADRVLTLLTARFGKVSAFARAARKSRKRFGGALEPFARLRVDLAERTRGATDLLELESASLVTRYGRLVGSLVAMAVAGYACELCRELLPPNEPAPAALGALFALFEFLEQGAGDHGTAASVAFELYLLDAIGQRPSLDRCAVCGKPAPAGASARLDPRRGGVVCSGCRSVPRGTFTLKGPVRDDLVRLQEKGLAAAASIEWSPSDREAAQRATRDLLATILGREPKTRALLTELGATR